MKLSEMGINDVVSINTQNEYDKCFELFKSVSTPVFMQGFDKPENGGYFFMGFAIKNKSQFLDGLSNDVYEYNIISAAQFIADNSETIKTTAL